MIRGYRVLFMLTVLYLGVVGWLTLRATPYDSNTSGALWNLLDSFAGYRQTDWITFDWLESAANVLMFVPIGLFFLLLLGRKRWWLAVLLGIALSIGIELWQGAFLASRVSDLRDVMANGFGAFLGAVLGIFVSAATDLRRRRLRPAL